MKKTALWIGAGALVVLCAAYVGVSSYLSASDKKKEAAEEAARIYVTDLTDTTEITKLSYKSGENEFTFEKDGDTWYYEPDRSFPLKQTVVTSLLDTAGKLEAKRKLDGGDDMAQYGLDAPSSYVTLAAADGTEHTVLIGNGTQDGAYYAAVKGEDTAYTIDSLLPGYLEKGLYDMIQLEQFPEIEGVDVKQITITKGEDVYHYEKKNIDSEGNIAWYEGSSADENNKMDSNGRGNTLADALSDLYVQSCVDYKAGAGDLSQYGLDQPNAIIWYSYEKNGQTSDMKLDIGSLDKDSTYYYTRREGSDAVNQISKETVDKCLNVGEDK